MPLYTASNGERSATTTALVPPFHAEMMPSSPAKMNRALVDAGITKSLVALKTIPVGAPPVLLPVVGMFTTSDCFTPAASYSVDVPVWLFATHRMPVGPKASPQGLTRFASMVLACSARSSLTSRSSS